MRRPEPLPSFPEIVQRLSTHGIDHVGVTTADVLVEARTALVERREQGLHDGMGFTYRDPLRSTDPVRAVAGARSVIVAARSYLGDDVPPPASAAVPARVARYAWVDHYAPLRSALREVATSIRRAGHRAVAFADDNAVVDRAVAHRAGLGWFGKNANLLLPGAGSWFVLGSIVTTADYTESGPDHPVADGCGSCRRCIEGCPTDAIIAPGVVDARRCISWILQKPGSVAPVDREAIDDRIYGCDDCQDVCPISVRLGPRHPAPPTDPPHEPGTGVQPWIDALGMLQATDEELLAAVGHWYVSGRDPRWLRRNALVVVGNRADPTDPRVRTALHAYAGSDDELLAEHARWALDRLGLATVAAAAP